MRAWLVIGTVVASVYIPAVAQNAHPPEVASEATIPLGAGPDMQRVVKALSGTWSITETDVPSAGTPLVTGSGTEVWYTATGGNTLIEENSTKSAHGDTHDTALIWWNGAVRKVQGLWCADINDEGCSSFGVRWEGTDIIMAGEWESQGQRRVWKEVFALRGVNAFTQTLYIGLSGGALNPVSVIHAKRNSSTAVRPSRG